jgi:CheY-like chemotaxis protein
MLEDLGHTVLVALSGEQAIEKLEHARAVDLVITDHAMPKMTGTDLAKVVTARRPGTPIILATGYAELPAGADAGLPRLAKPYRQEDLVDAIASAIGTGQE